MTIQTPDQIGDEPNSVVIPFELESLSRAKNYQFLIFKSIERFLGKRILEVGAGVGNMSRWLSRAERLILTESDGNLFEILKVNSREFASDRKRCLVDRFTVGSDDGHRYRQERIDTVISFNVLEHIEDDSKAICNLASLFEPEADYERSLITFVPAQPWAMSNLDRKFGHYRRYSASDLERLARNNFPQARHRTGYVNCLGLLGWVVRSKLFGSEKIGSGNIELFDKLCLWFRPLDKVLLDWLRLPLGLSVYSVLTFPPGVKIDRP